MCLRSLAGAVVAATIAVAAAQDAMIGASAGAAAAAAAGAGGGSAPQRPTLSAGVRNPIINQPPEEAVASIMGACERHRRLSE